MRPVHYQPLQQDPGDLFLDSFCVSLSKEVKKGAAEVVSMTVWVAQLIGNGIQEQVPACNEQGVSRNYLSISIFLYPSIHIPGLYPL